jgi:hypothetical protein
MPLEKFRQLGLERFCRTKQFFIERYWTSASNNIHQKEYVQGSQNACELQKPEKEPYCPEHFVNLSLTINVPSKVALHFSL